MLTNKKLIGEYLIEDGKITHDQLQQALEIQANSIQGGRMPLIGTVLVEMGALRRRDLEAALERQEADRTGGVRVPVRKEENSDEIARQRAAEAGSREDAESKGEYRSSSV